MFIAYFDGSGKMEDSKALSMACLVSRAQDWEKFETKWQRILRRHNVTVMHMTDFNAREREFKGWDDYKRTAFIATLAGVTEKAMRLGVFHTLVVKEWVHVFEPSIPTKYKKRRLPYLVLIQTCLEDIAELVRLPDGEKIALVFEQDRSLDGAITDWFQGIMTSGRFNSKLETISFGTKAIVPLQAADMLAYEGRRTLEDKVLAEETKPIRKLLASLSVSGKISGGRYDRDALRAMCDEMYGGLSDRAEDA